MTLRLVIELDFPDKAPNGEAITRDMIEGTSQLILDALEVDTLYSIGGAVQYRILTPRKTRAVSQ